MAREWLRRLSGDHCPVAMPWFDLGPAGDPAGELRRRALRCEWELAEGAGERALLLLRAAAWPLAASRQAVRLLRRHGHAAAREAGVGRLAQLLQMLRVAIVHNLAPEIYYRFELFRPERRREAALYAANAERIVVGRYLISRLDNAALDHKARFHAACTRLGLPVAPVIAKVEAGRIAWTSGAELPRRDLMLKPCGGSSGIGIERWLLGQDGASWCRGAERLDERGLLDRAAGLSREDAHLICPRLTNDPEIAPFTLGGLATFRVVTARRAGGDPVPLMMALRMPTGHAAVDNFHSGGIAAAVELTTGVMGPALGMDFTRGPFRAHPDTGALVEGHVVRRWREVCELAVTAHREFADFSTIGWDVALTTAGPILMEANTFWCWELVQRVGGRPLGRTELPAHLLRDLAAARQRSPRAVRATG